jgi:hypothetical protein
MLSRGKTPKSESMSSNEFFALMAEGKPVRAGDDARVFTRSASREAPRITATPNGA